MTKKRSIKVPDNLKALAASGQRVRYNGFWMGESNRDRMIADWLDSTPQAGAIIKAMIYSMITGQGFVAIRDMSVQDQADDYPEPDDTLSAAGSALLELDE